MKSTLKLGMFLLSLWMAPGGFLPATEDSPSAAGELKLYTSRLVESGEGTPEKYVYQTLRWDPHKTAVVVCDLWDKHWCNDAAARMAEMAPRIEAFLSEARRRGALIIHAPSGCMAAYANHPAHRRAGSAPAAEMPACRSEACTLLVGAKQWALGEGGSAGGCGCPTPCKPGQPQSRQIEGVTIADADAISDSTVEIGNLFAQRGIENVMLLGLWNEPDTLGGPLKPSFLNAWGLKYVVVRDLTLPAFRPVKAAGGSRHWAKDLAMEYIERHICPTTTGGSLLGGPAFRFRDDKRPHIAMMANENEYEPEQTLSEFGRMLRDEYDCYCTVAYGPGQLGIDGLEELDDADAAVLYVRRLALPKEQLDRFRAYLDAGKPLVALRTSSHGFAYGGGRKLPPGADQWKTFDPEVLGGQYHGHVQTGGADIRMAPKAAGHPILKGFDPPQWKTEGTLYWSSPLSDQVEVLVIGSTGHSVEPVAWTHAYKGGRVFFTELGHQKDFVVPQFRAMLRNAIFWVMDRPVPVKP